MSLRGQDLWRWPLWSWKHFTITCMVLAAVLVGIGRLQSSGADSGAGSPTTRAVTSRSVSESATSPTPATQSKALIPTATAPSQSESIADPGEVSGQFVAGWARPYDPPSEWRGRLLPLSTKEFAAELSKTDPLRVPATAVVGEGTEVARAANSRTMRHTTDNGGVLVFLKRTGSRWLVSGIAPDESAGGVP
ncbi:hypothetical protein GCM10022415_15820 [Knoellia locipacati]|uniref:Uncharacterized protein n=1 Tax=Knoellia locipacati TaxID=882824 RepID=A0A512T010_9MICO|nr:hypothetical protein KLO01_15790 [Knoellia locipacati]